MNCFIVYCLTPKSVGVTHIEFFWYRKVIFLDYGVYSLYRDFVASKKTLNKYRMFQGNNGENLSWNIQYLLIVLLLPSIFLEKNNCTIHMEKCTFLHKTVLYMSRWKFSISHLYLKTSYLPSRNWLSNKKISQSFFCWN